MTRWKLSLSLWGMGLCLFPMQYSADVRWVEATLQLYMMQLPWWLPALARTSCSTALVTTCTGRTSCWAAVFWLLLSKLACSKLRRSQPPTLLSKEQQPGPASLLSPGQKRALGECRATVTSCFSPFTPWVQSSRITTGKAKENHCQSITIIFPDAPSPMEIPWCKLISLRAQEINYPPLGWLTGWFSEVQMSFGATVANS